MSELIVANYHDPLRAGQVLEALRQDRAEWSVDLDDAIVFVKRADGTAQLLAPYSANQRNPEVGVLSALLDTLFLPIARPGGLTWNQNGREAPGPVARAINAAWWQEQLGLADEFVQQVRRMLRPGDSALLMLIRRSDPDLVMDEMRCYGGRLLQASVMLYRDILNRHVLNTSSV